MSKHVCIVAFICFLAGSCSNNVTNINEHPQIEGDRVLYVAESDYTSGKIEWLSDPDSQSLTGEMSTYKDAIVRAYKGSLYALERFGADNIIRFGKNTAGEWGKLYQTHISNNANPTDIAFTTDTTAFITCLNSGKITKINPLTGKITGTIDLSAYIFNPDSNVSPNANAIIYTEGMLYVLLQRLNGWTPVLPTLIVKINPSTKKITDTIPLNFKNGHSMVYSDGIIYVSNPGVSSVIGDGAIEAVNLNTGEVTTIVTEETLGGNPNKIVLKTENRLYVQNYIDWGVTAVNEVDLASGKVVATLSGLKDAFGGLVFDQKDKLLYVGEREPESAGVKVYSNNSMIGNIRKSGNSLPPVDMVLVE